MADLLSLFPAGSSLVIGGCRADDLAAEFGTPVLVVAEQALRARAREHVTELSSRWANSRARGLRLEGVSLHRCATGDGRGRRRARRGRGRRDPHRDEGRDRPRPDRPARQRNERRGVRRGRRRVGHGRRAALRERRRPRGRGRPVGSRGGRPARRTRNGRVLLHVSNNHNRNRRIPVVFVREGQPRLVVRRETWDDLSARDVD